MIIKDVYENRLSKIIKSITEIANDSTISKAAQSHKIMKLLRDECVFVNKDYLVRANHKDCATLNPDDDGVRNLIISLDNATDWFPIFANSFGPFDPIRYFESPFKILWLLKEPYITKESWIKGDRGGHNQAKYNRYWDQIENNTIKNIINLTKYMLINIQKIMSSNQLGEISNQYIMNHVCILEVNHFSGLYFKSYKTDDNRKEEQFLKWTNYNKKLIKTLIDFYEANIVIGGFTFMGQFASNENLLNYYATKENGELPFTQGKSWEYVINEKPIDKTLFDHNIVRPWGQDGKRKTKKLSMVKTEDNRYWINAYHPVQTNNGTNKPNLIKFAKEIYKDLNLALNLV